MKIMFLDLQGLRKMPVSLMASTSTSYNILFPKVDYLIILLLHKIQFRSWEALSTGNLSLNI